MTTAIQSSNENYVWQVRFEIPNEALPLFSETLEESFDTFSSRRDDTLKPWIIECISQTKPDMDELKNMVGILSETLGIETPELILEQVENIDWLEHVYQLFQPFEVGRFFVHGSHFNGEIPSGKVPLNIDAATAFGTGEHGTTKGCLLAIDHLGNSMSPKNALDMGCGSGILAIAMAHVFKIPVLAVDNDPESTRVTAERAIANSAQNFVTADCGDGFNTPSVQQQQPFDLIAANILAEPLVEMAPQLVATLSDNGMVILSGLLAEQEERVRSAYEELGLKKVADFPIEGWQAIIMQKG